MSTTRPRPFIRSDVPPKLPNNISPEGRERLSELAKQRHRDGTLRGGRTGSGSVPATASPRQRKPSRKRIAQLVAMAALEEKTAQDIIDVFKDGIHDSQPMSIRLKAAEAWLKIEHDESKLALRETDSEAQQRDRGELLDFLQNKLIDGHAGVLLRRRIEEQAGVIDVDPANVVDIDPATAVEE